jgi:hypothetical protein
MSPQDQLRQVLRRANVHKARLRRQFHRELAGEFNRSIPVVAALAETLIEAVTANMGPVAAVELLKRMIDQVQRDGRISVLFDDHRIR